MTLTSIKRLFYNNSLLITVHIKLSKHLENISFLFSIMLYNFLLNTSAKSRSVRGASHRPAFMSSCLTISHTRLPCLPSGRVSASVPGVV